ncbi:hypothetical protein Tco_0140226 [Tanacetum coccineum]
MLLVQMSTDVARGHGGGGGGDDRPPSHQMPTGCGGCLGNRGKGTRKPNLGGRRAGRQHTRQETRNLGLKAITDKSGPVTIRFEFGNKDTLMPLAPSAGGAEGGDHGSDWGKPSLTCVPTWNSIAGHLSMRPSSSIYKRSTMARRLLLRNGIGFLTRTRLTTWSASDYHVLRTFPRSIGMRRLRSGMIPRTMESSATREYPSLIHTFFLTHTVNGVFLNPEDKALYDEMLRLQGLGSNTETGVPYTEDEIMAIVRGGKQWGHIPGVGRVLPGQGTVIPPPPPCTHSSDVVKLKKKEKVITRQVNMFMKLFRSDDKFSQMLTQLESQPEIGGGSGSDGGAGMISREMMRTTARTGRMRTIVRRC